MEKKKDDDSKIENIRDYREYGIIFYDILIIEFIKIYIYFNFKF